MITRTSRKIVTFAHAFLLKGVDRILPPGEYPVIMDEELIEGLSFSAYFLGKGELRSAWR